MIRKMLITDIDEVVKIEERVSSLDVLPTIRS